MLFSIQGEGRGHMTQSIALKNILSGAGFDLCGVLVGTSSNRKLPDFFVQQIGVEITQFRSPNFVMDDKMKSIKVAPSIIQNFLKLPVFIQSMRLIHKTIKECKPDVIINFYDPLMGWYNKIYKTGIPMIAIAHQYIFHHPEFEFPKESNKIDRAAVKLFTSLTGKGAAKRLALSFYPFTDYPKKRVHIVPPLLRPEVHTQQVTNGNYILVYLVNSGYRDDIIRWHEENPDVELHCFSDGAGEAEIQRYDDKLFFHKINDKKFLQMMAGAMRLVSTAGFESICEALYFGKPALMVPVQGHFEQYCNARDAAKAGAGIYSDHFDISRFLAYLPHHNTDHAAFRKWADSSREIIINHIREVVGRKLKN